MIRIGFQKNAEGEAVCNSTGDGIRFDMNPLPFENRGHRFYGDALLFDGYSIWFEDEGDAFRREGNFTVSFYLAPLGYSDQGDGIFSLSDREGKEGFCVLIEKQGKLQVRFGNGRTAFAFRTIDADAVKNMWNIITVVFHEDAGWCDIFVNGIFSNRKQFPRHMKIKWPERKAVLGNYGMEEIPVGAGAFYGLFREMAIEDRALSTEEVKRLHASYQRKETGCILPDRSLYKGDVQRPAYHMIAPGKWMNEPHAPLYFDGYYHIFYQANPHAPVWNNIQWGHMVSKDMVHWEDMPLALETGTGSLDPDGCWSGSSLVDREGIPRIFYTAGNNGRFPNQFVAMAKAVVGEDTRLPRWEKQEEPIVEQSEGWFGEFRDPFVWLEKDTYFMLVGTGDEDNGGGNAVLYSSKDMLHWQSHGFLLDYDYEKNQELGHVFELPVLLPLRDESGSVVCHIFLMCACQIEGRGVENYAFLGKWEPEKEKFSKFHEKAMAIDLGNGHFTGPSGLVTPDKRSVVFSIAQGMRDGRDTYLSGWAHNGGLPHELSIRNGELAVAPIREIYGLKKKELLHLRDVSIEEAHRELEKYGGNSFYLRVCLDGERLDLGTSGDGQEKVVYYDRGESRFGVLDGTGAEKGLYRGPEDDVDIAGNAITMEYFLDHSMIEVYLNQKKSITLRNYIQGKERRIALSGTGTVRELELWEMDTAYA